MSAACPTARPSATRTVRPAMAARVPRQVHARPGVRCPGLGRALAAWPEPAQASAAAGLIARALDGFPEPEDPVWQASRLTRTGLPVELGFATADPDLRYTVEVDRPDRPCRDRLGRALDLCADLGPASVSGDSAAGGSPAGRPGSRVWPPGLLARLAEAQAMAPDELEYGCWLGVRHRARAAKDAAARTDLKLYVEIPPSAWPGLAAWEEELVARPAILPGREVRVVMVGVEPADQGGSHRLELYYQAVDVRAAEVVGLLRRAGLGDETRAAEVLAVLERAYGLSLERGMPSPDLGFSYAFESGRCTSMTLYHAAAMVFGGDGSIRRGLLGLAERHGWDLTTYEQLSRPLEGRFGYDTFHGMLGIVAPAPGGIALGLGLAPPPVGASGALADLPGRPLHSP